MDVSVSEPEIRVETRTKTGYAPKALLDVRTEDPVALKPNDDDDGYR